MTRGHSGWMALPDAPHPRDLTDEQWNFIGPFLSELARRKDGRGRPWRENRAVFNGILWILRTGAPWADLPNRYLSYQTCHRRFQPWVRSGVLRSVLEVLAQALDQRPAIDASWQHQSPPQTRGMRPLPALGLTVLAIVGAILTRREDSGLLPRSPSSGTS